MSTKRPPTMDEEFQAALQRLDALVQAFDTLPYPQVREMAFDLLQTIDMIHRESLTRLIGFLRAAGEDDLIEGVGQDPVVHTLLLLYDLVPTDDRIQVEAALDTIRPAIHAHGGEVDVLGVEDGVVHLRLAGACRGCTASDATLQYGIEQTLREGFPGFRGIQVHEPAETPGAPTAGFIPLSHLGEGPPPSQGAATLARTRQPVFTDVAGVEEVPAGTMRAFEVGGGFVLIANVGGEVHAVQGNCPGSIAPLHLGVFSPPVVTCPWHNEAYDVRTGKRVDGSREPRLDVLPVSVRAGRILLAGQAQRDTPAAAR